MLPPIYVLTGPTAVGKTALAIQWAIEHGAEIVSCDSRLFYQGMSMGTAKPTLEEQALVPHHLIDCSPVSRQVNVSQFVEAALDVVQGIQRREKKVLIVGGSGFYLKSFYAPVCDAYPSDDGLRASLRAIEVREGYEGLVQRLKDLNPEGVEGVDLQNPRRVYRALERCLVSGKSLRLLAQEFHRLKSPFDAWPKRTCLLVRSKVSLSVRIQKRTQLMLAAGLVDEVRRLMSQGILQNPSARSAIGYREVLAWLDTGEEPDSLAEAINQSTQRLVAKQLKWFRHQLEPDYCLDLDKADQPEHGNGCASISLFQEFRTLAHNEDKVISLARYKPRILD